MAPFVSRLKADVTGPAIVLTWRDSPDVKGPVLVYRDVAEITKATLPDAEFLAEVAYGEGSYTDYPQDTRPYFYAVLAGDEAGTRFEVLVPFRNKTLSPRRIQVLGTPEQLAATITGISATVTAGGISVRFSTNRPGRPLILYRSSSPIEDFQDLVTAVPIILEPRTKDYLDSPPAGLAFFYAVVDEELLKVGRPGIVPGENATMTPVRIPLTAAAIVTAERRKERASPLPLLVLDRTVYSGGSISPAIVVPAEETVARQTEESIDAIVQRQAEEPFAPLVLQVLAIDKASVGGSDQYILHEIVTDLLERGKIVEAAGELEGFLRVRRAPDIEARAHFYLGQALYLQGRYSEALFEFLEARDLYYAQAEPWVDSCLEWLIRPR
jgi:hypothetical protein